MGKRPDDSEFREMSDEQLETEWQAIEDYAADYDSFHTIRALYVLRERVRRIEGKLRRDLELDERFE
jgi:hypothetical protein